MVHRYCLGCFKCIPVSVGVAAIVIVHIGEFTVLLVDFRNTIFYSFCRLAMAPFFLSACCCIGDSHELRARRFLFQGYSLISCIEFLAMSFTTLMVFLDTDSLAGECFKEIEEQNEWN